MLKSHHTEAKALKYRGHLMKYLKKRLNKTLKLKSLKYKLSTLSSLVCIEINNNFMFKASVKVIVKDPETLTVKFMKGIKQLIELNNTLKWELKETCTIIILTKEKLVHISLVTEWLNAYILNLANLVINTINFTGDLVREIKDTQFKGALHTLVELK